MDSAVFINNDITDSISSQSRSIHYGDGLFETILVKNSKPLLLDKHLERLDVGVSKLFYKGFNKSFIEQLVHSQSKKVPNCVIKLIISRNQKTRAYKVDKNANMEVFLYSYPVPVKKKYIKLMVCQTNLARQPMLAKIKHLNRLEQVLASNELKKGFDDGVLFLQGTDELIETITSNIFLIKNDEIATPLITNAGVEGVAKRKIIETAKDNGYSIVEKRLSKNDLINAEFVFLTNSIFGIRIVKEIDGYTYQTESKVINDLVAYTNKYFI